MGGDVLVRLDGVGKRFRPPPAPWRRWLRLPPAADVVALDSVDLEVRAGEVLGLVGPNGAGKTVLVKLVATLIEPSAGSVRVFGLDPLRDGRAVRRRIGLTTTDERSFYWRLTARQNLTFFARLHGHTGDAGRRRVDELLDVVELTASAARPYRTLSAGNRQRLGIARALLADPDLLLLDEPTASLDPGAARRLRELIRDRVAADRRRAVLFTTHDLAEVDELCDRVVVLGSGRTLWSGAVADLRSRHGGRDQVVLRVRGDHAAAVAAEHAAQALPTAPGEWELSFADDPDTTADVIAGLTARGARVVGCHTRVRRLEAIVEDLVCSAPPPQVASGNGRPAQPPAPAPPEVPRGAGPLPVLRAFLARDAVMATSYRLEFVLQLASVLFYVSALYFLSRLIGDNASVAQWGGYLPFAAIGMAVASWFQVGFDSFAKAIHREQLHGTLEALLLAPLRLSTIVVASSGWRFAWTSVVSSVYVAAAVLLYDISLQGSVALAVLLLLLTTLAFASLGILSASFLMVYKRGDPIGMALGGLSTLLGGVFFPVSALPEVLRALAWCLPITHGLDAIRAVLLQGAGLATVWPRLLVLAGFAAVGVPLALVCFRRAVRRAQREGTLLHF